VPALSHPFQERVDPARHPVQRTRHGQERPGLRFNLLTETSTERQDTRGPVLSSEILAISQGPGLLPVFPPRYHLFLKQHNGGIPNRRRISIAGHWDGTDLFDIFYGVHYPDPLFDVVKCGKEFPEYTARQLLPIGETAGSSLVCVDLSQPGTEPIVYLDVADSEDPLTRRAYFVANDIFEFCSRLQA